MHANIFYLQKYILFGLFTDKIRRIRKNQ